MMSDVPECTLCCSAIELLYLARQINHEVQAVQLKCEAVFLWVQLVLNSRKGMASAFLHLRNDCCLRKNKSWLRPPGEASKFVEAK